MEQLCKLRVEFILHCNYGARVYAEAVASNRFVPKYVEGFFCFFFLVTYDSALCNLSAVES